MIEQYGGDILLSIVTICTLLSYLPQTVKLIRTKQSKDISIGSWILWVISSLSYSIYAYIYSNDLMLRVETTMECFFCVLTLSLSLLYRFNQREKVEGDKE